MPFSSDQLRCSLLQNFEDNSINYALTRLDGTIVEEIDIGQEPWPHSWPQDKKDFTWKFIDHTPDMKYKVQRVAFQNAFNSVEKLTELTMTFVKGADIKTDITVEWKEDIETFDNKRGVLAHAYLYFPNSKKNGVMEFNDSPDSRWYFTPLGWPVEASLVDPVNYTKGQKDPRTGELLMLKSQPTVEIAMHELGHILFGRHDLINKESMMYPYVKPGYVNGELNKGAFYWDDITSIPRMVEKFGSSNIVSHHIARWRGRRVNERTYRRHY